MALPDCCREAGQPGPCLNNRRFRRNSASPPGRDVPACSLHRIPEGRHARRSPGEQRATAKRFANDAQDLSGPPGRGRRRRLDPHGVSRHPAARSRQRGFRLTSRCCRTSRRKSRRGRRRPKPRANRRLRGHLKAEGDEQGGSRSYVPSEAKDDKALNRALDLITRINPAFPPNPKSATLPN
jgi:hypothetical protein